MQKISLFILIILFFINCYNMPGMPGSITKSESKFDGSIQLKMEPAWVDGTFKIALFKSSRMPDSLIVLNVLVKGIHKIPPEESFHLNIDGKFYSFSSVDLYEDHEVKEGIVTGYSYMPPSAWSSMRYVVPIKLIRDMVNGKRVIVKINIDKGFIEGEFSKDDPTAARPAFIKFLKEIEKL